MKQRLRNKVRLAERRASAAERAAAHAQLTPQQKLAKLDTRLGVGAGAKSERQRLLKAISEGQKPVVKATAEAVFGVNETKPQKKGNGRGPKTKNREQGA